MAAGAAALRFPVARSRGRRYPEPAGTLAPDSTKKKEEFRDYRADAKPAVTDQKEAPPNAAT